MLKEIMGGQRNVGDRIGIRIHGGVRIPTGALAIHEMSEIQTAAWGECYEIHERTANASNVYNMVAPRTMMSKPRAGLVPMPLWELPSKKLNVDDDGDVLADCLALFPLALPPLCPPCPPA